jgi:5-(carboxyamino)imidazole ribonucleotide synthase
VEMFLLGNSKILVNEIAPRVHNSGHITMDACNLSQFEQHLRAITGMELISPRWTAKEAVMLNILGTKNGGKPEFGSSLNVPENLSLYWYGKTELRVGRKLGHINSVGKTQKEALTQAEKLRKKLIV